MTLQSNDIALENIVDLLPEEVGNPQMRERLRKFTSKLDELFFLDESKKLAVDYDSLMKIIRDKDLIPIDSQDLIICKIDNSFANKTKNKKGSHYIKWNDAAQYGFPTKQTSLARLRELGIDKSSSVSELRRILQEHYPDIPAFWLDADADQIKNTTLQALSSDRTVWDCVVAHLGEAAAILIFALVGGLLIVGTATGPWGIPLAIWLIGVIGAGNAVIVGNCVINPNS